MKLYFTIFSVIITGIMHAQVSTYPYSQSFEDPFTNGHNVSFLPDWWGNYVTLDTMGQYDAFAHSGSHALFMLPEGEEFKTIVQVKLDLSYATNTFAEFWVASRKNGAAEDEKRVKLNAAISVNGGLTFPYVTGIGPHEGFQNADTDFEKFLFVFPPITNNQPNVVLRFIAKSGGGPHLPGMLLLDDITVAQAESDIFPPYIMGSELSISVINSLKIPFSEPLLSEPALTLTNYNFTWPVEEDGTPVIGEGPLPQVSNIQQSSDGYSIVLTLDPPLSIGETYVLQMSNITDLNNNVADLLTVDGIVFNEPAPGSLVFSEVLFADPSSTYPKGKLQYVELYNPTNDVVPLGGLRIKGSIAAHDLPNVKLQPGEYWVATRNAASYLATFGKAAWEWKGSWIEYEAEEGEALEPQSLFIQTTNRHSGKLVDSIGFDFSDPAWAVLNKPGYSIELCDPLSDNHDPANWSLANDSEPYYYTANEIEYLMHATPGTGCQLFNQTKYYCTYAQGFYGIETENSCSVNGIGSTSLEMMQAVLPIEKQQVFGLNSTNRYFVLKGSDIYNGFIFNMLPGGKNPAPLLSAGGSTYSTPASWSTVPISKSKNAYGKIENGLLSQAITLFFNMGWNSRKISMEKFTLSTVKLQPFMTAAESTDCELDLDTAFQNQNASISQRLVDYLNSNYVSGATVGNLFNLANRMLGGDPALVRFSTTGKPVYTNLTASEIASALDAINNLFDECRVYVPIENQGLSSGVALRTSMQNEWGADENSFSDIITGYPNPFSDQVTIVFGVPVDTWAVLQIYTSDGTKVETLFEGTLKANELRQVTFVPAGYASGFYTYKLSAGSILKVGRLLSIR